MWWGDVGGNGGGNKDDDGGDDNDGDDDDDDDDDEDDEGRCDSDWRLIQVSEDNRIETCGHRRQRFPEEDKNELLTARMVSDG